MKNTTKRKRVRPIFLIALVLTVVVGVEYGLRGPRSRLCSALLKLPAAAVMPGVDAGALVESARAQIGVTKSYDPAYVKLDFPGGDVPMETGVCSDVVVRALRAQNIDLQVLVNADMGKNFSAYPNPVKWQLFKADPNIDHRRVLNLERYFTRAGKSLPITQNPDNYLPGDIVSWNLNPSGSLPHIGIVSDKKSDKGVPLIIHNIGRGTREHDILFKDVITGHFRLK